ncbi:hypothetical protein Bca4012_007814 [Brassica carinata]
MAVTLLRQLHIPVSVAYHLIAIGSVLDSLSAVSPTENGSVSDVEKFLCERLVDQSQPISERFRALFSPRNLKGPGPRNALILAAESLGAIGLAGNAEILKQSLVLDPAQEVRETCELALKRIEDLSSVDAEKELDTTKTAHAAAFSSVHQLSALLRIPSFDDFQFVHELA